MKRIIWVAACVALVFAIGGLAYGIQESADQPVIDVSAVQMLADVRLCDAKLSAETTETVVALETSPKDATSIAKVSSSSSPSGSSSSSSTYYPDFGSGTCGVAASGSNTLVTFKLYDKSGAPMSGVRFRVAVDFTALFADDSQLPADYTTTLVTSGGVASMTIAAPASGGSMTVYVTGFIPISPDANRRIGTHF